jgi:hypothetical protein
LKCAAVFAILSFVQTEKNMAFVVRLTGSSHLGWLGWGGCSLAHGLILVWRAEDKRRIK